MAVDTLYPAPEIPPADATSFIGRQREMAQIRQLMEHTRLLTLTGPPGVGKTRLALRIAADTRRGFPDGTGIVDLAPVRSPDLVLRTVARSLGLVDRPARPLRDALRAFLAGKHLLLILDNCEHLRESCSTLVRELLEAAPGLQVLATSRHALDAPGETVLEVPPLSLPDDSAPVTAADLARSDAAILLLERVWAALPGFPRTPADRQAVAALCRRLDGIPLAIELAAVSLRSMPPGRVLDRLGDRFPEPATRRKGVPRQRTLRAAIDWSRDLCTPEERTLWARMSVFAGSFDLAAAEEICSGGPVPREKMVDLVSALITKSILMRVSQGPPARYRMLEIIRQYGAELLAGSGERDTVHRRYRDYYAQMISHAEEWPWFGRDQQLWYERLRADHANLRNVLDLSGPGQERTVFEMVGSAWNYWVGAGAIGEGRHLLEAALARDRSPTAERLHALRGAAHFAIVLGDSEAAASYAGHALTTAELLGGDAFTVAHATEILGLAAFFGGDAANAVPLLQQALHRYRATGAPPGVIMLCLNMLAFATCVLGDSDGALDLAEQALTLNEIGGGERYLFLSLWVLAFVRYRHGDLQEADALVRQSLRIERSIGERYNAFRGLELLAWVGAALDRPRYAARILGAADAARRAIGMPRLTIACFPEFHDACAARLRAALGEKAFTAAFRQGTALGLGQAVGDALEENAGDTGRPARPASVLTRRERQVAALIAEGRTNKEIAARLVIAQRTAEGHVEHIMSKLGFGSRAQIAAWAAEHRDDPEPALHPP